jgi:hypothetical protein
MSSTSASSLALLVHNYLLSLYTSKHTDADVGQLGAAFEQPVYLLYWYKSTKTDAGGGEVGAAFDQELSKSAVYSALLVQKYKQ